MKRIWPGGMLVYAKDLLFNPRYNNDKDVLKERRKLKKYFKQVEKREITPERFNNLLVDSYNRLPERLKLYPTEKKERLEERLAIAAAVVFLVISVLFLDLSRRLSLTGAVIIDVAGQTTANIPFVYGILFLILSILLFIRKR